MDEPLKWISAELRALAAAGLDRSLETVEAVEGPYVRLRARRLLNFASNNYLGLALDPRVTAAAADAARLWGAGSTASPLIVGRTALYEQLERAIADFKRLPAALLFPSGYAANLGVLSALASPGDLILADRLDHASLLDGARLSRATLRTYRHCSPDNLERTLRSSRARYRRCFVVTDSLFSMDGDLAPLPALLELCARFDAVLIADEAHATGVLGPAGRGAFEHFGLREPDACVTVGTLSKVLGSQGGFVAGSAELIRFVLNRARSYVFSTALAPAACAAALAALAVLRESPELVARLRSLSESFRALIADVPGARPPSDLPSPIVPVICGAPERALRARDALFERGFLVPAVRPPSVPRGTARLRVSLSAFHTPDHLASLARALADVLRTI